MGSGDSTLQQTRQWQFDIDGGRQVFVDDSVRLYSSRLFQ